MGNNSVTIRRSIEPMLLGQEGMGADARRLALSPALSLPLPPGPPPPRTLSLTPSLPLSPLSPSPPRPPSLRRARTGRGRRGLRRGGCFAAGRDVRILGAGGAPKGLNPHEPSQDRRRSLTPVHIFVPASILFHSPSPFPSLSLTLSIKTSFPRGVIEYFLFIYSGLSSKFSESVSHARPLPRSLHYEKHCVWKGFPGPSS